MSTTAPDTPHQSPSCDNGSDAKALKKRVEQLVEENDELRRDKRSFRDASDESRRTLARMRDDIKELRRKLELERSEKEKALGEVKELQAEVAKAKSHAEDKLPTPPLEALSVPGELGSTGYPSPVEPCVPRLGAGETDERSGKGEGRPFDESQSGIPTQADASPSNLIDSAGPPSRTYPSPAESDGVPILMEGTEGQPKEEKRRIETGLRKRGHEELSNAQRPTKKAKTESPPLKPSPVASAVSTTIGVEGELSNSSGSIASSSPDVVVDPRRRPKDVRFLETGDAPKGQRETIAPRPPAKGTPPHMRPSHPHLPGSHSAQSRPNAKVESPERRRGDSSKPLPSTVRFGGHSIGPPAEVVKPTMSRVPFPYKGSSNNSSRPQPVPVSESNVLRLPPKPILARDPPPSMNRPPPRPASQGRGTNGSGRSPPRPGPPPFQGPRPQTVQAYFTIPNVTLPPSHMDDLEGYEHVPSRSRRGGSYAHGGRP